MRLNAAMRSFLWIVHAPSRLRGELQERYRTPPDPGSVIIADADAETWEAVTPILHAADAEKDGRAIRWMIVAGGPGTSLLDIGEGEDSNLATGKAMAEQRRRFLRRRQSYLAHMLIDLTWRAWELGHCVDGPALARGQSVRRTDEPVRRTDELVRRTDITRAVAGHQPGGQRGPGGRGPGIGLRPLADGADHGRSRHLPHRRPAHVREVCRRDALRGRNRPHHPRRNPDR